MPQKLILTLNSGSSSIKFAGYSIQDVDAPARLSGQIEAFGGRARLTLGYHDGPQGQWRYVAAMNHRDAIAVILDLISERLPDAHVVAAGHRVVHGGKDFSRSVIIDPNVLMAIESLIPLAPLHQPHNLAGIEAAMSAFPRAIQVACFDTAFHRSHPMVADMYALPLQFHTEGIRRYGFHGLSYEYLALRLAIVAPHLAGRRVVLAHLGNGASLCALNEGRSVASTMGFTALDGVPMGTRTGQIDPGVLLYLMSVRNMTVDEITDLLYRNSGLKGISSLSNDIRDLQASNTPEAALAIDYFVHRVRREIGALAAEMGGVDAVVFAGGIGERAGAIRARILDGLDFLGVAYDPDANHQNSERLSPSGTKTPVFVIPTNEEWMIAHHVRLHLGASRG